MATCISLISLKSFASVSCSNSPAIVATPNGQRQFLDILIREKLILAAAQDSEVPRSVDFRVRLDRIKGYNQVNLSLGYGIMTIVSPKEVRFDESRILEKIPAYPRL